MKCAVEACRRTGSSPLARGTPPTGIHAARRRRFIPARAGNTSRPRRVAIAGSVHPRSRGEHRKPPVLEKHRIGSSPLARGTHGAEGRRAAWSRFIPARAGNTSGEWLVKDEAQVHPRSRGEHPPTSGAACSSCGSSPLARGTPGRGPGATSPRRFIPARAGNTSAPGGW